MISKVNDKDELYELLSTENDVYTEKIRSLADAYGTKYDFCNFYKQTGGTVISDYYGSACVAKSRTRPGDRLAELMEFLMCGKFRKVIMPFTTFDASNVDANYEKLCLMRYEGGSVKTPDSEKITLADETELTEISEIVADGFELDFNNWYTDISHMIRHGISRVYMLENNCCLVRMFASAGISYLSYVCTRKTERGKGLATRLIKAVCALETDAGNPPLVFCRNELLKFYEDTDFRKINEAVELTI